MFPVKDNFATIKQSKQDYSLLKSAKMKKQLRQKN